MCIRGNAGSRKLHLLPTHQEWVPPLPDEEPFGEAPQSVPDSGMRSRLLLSGGTLIWDLCLIRVPKSISRNRKRPFWRRRPTAPHCKQPGSSSAALLAEKDVVKQRQDIKGRTLDGCTKLYKLLSADPCTLF